METTSTIDFSKNQGLVPCIVQDAVTNIVLMLGFMNAEALEKTRHEKKVTFYSRTKNRLWTKGETSGHFLEVKSLLVDCDSDTILIKATPLGPVCHTGADTCFGERNTRFDLAALEAIIRDRKENPKAGSYTTTLFQSGLNKIAQKVGEEAVELIIEAKDEDRGLFLNECGDLLYHLLVLLAAKEHTLSEVLDVLKQRHSK